MSFNLGRFGRIEEKDRADARRIRPRARMSSPQASSAPSLSPPPLSMFLPGARLPSKQKLARSTFPAPAAVRSKIATYRHGEVPVVVPLYQPRGSRREDDATTDRFGCLDSKVNNICSGYENAILSLVQQGPYHDDSTASRLLSEVKHRRARLVLRWGTTLESRVFLFYFFLLEVGRSASPHRRPLFQIVDELMKEMSCLYTTCVPIHER
jgi:hypothetical protein